MADSEFPAPDSGLVLTHFLVVSDQDSSREFYRRVFGATVVGQTTARTGPAGRIMP